MPRPRTKLAAGRIAGLTAVVAVTALVGCGNDLAGLPERPAPAGSAPQAYPDLADVPQRPATTTVQQRQEVARGLAADRANARREAEELQNRSLDRALPPPPPNERIGQALEQRAARDGQQANTGTPTADGPLAVATTPGLGLEQPPQPSPSPSPQPGAAEAPLEPARAPATAGADLLEVLQATASEELEAASVAAVAARAAERARQAALQARTAAETAGPPSAGAGSDQGTAAGEADVAAPAPAEPVGEGPAAPAPGDPDPAAAQDLAAVEPAVPPEAGEALTLDPVGTVPLADTAGVPVDEAQEAAAVAVEPAAEASSARIGPAPVPQPAPLRGSREERVQEAIDNVEAEDTLVDFLERLERSQVRRAAATPVAGASLAEAVAVRPSPPEELAPELEPARDLLGGDAPVADRRSPEVVPLPPARADATEATATAEQAPSDAAPAEPAAAPEEEAAQPRPAPAPAPPQQPAPTLAERAAEVEPARLPATGPVRVSFDEGSARPAPEASAALRLLADELREGQGRVRVVAGGEPAVLALDRARAVAVRLVQGGVSGERLELQTGGEADAVVVYRPSPGA